MLDLVKLTHSTSLCPKHINYLSQTTDENQLLWIPGVDYWLAHGLQFLLFTIILDNSLIMMDWCTNMYIVCYKYGI